MGDVTAVDGETDLRIGLVRVDFRRRYRSARSHEKHAMLGPGWSCSFERHLREGELTTVLRDEEGRDLHFDKLRVGEHVCNRADPGERGERGEHATLHRDAPLEWRVRHHATELTSTYRAALSGGRALLREVHDISGNGVHFEYDGGRLNRVVDTTGRVVRLAWFGDRLARWEVVAAETSGLSADYCYSPEGCLVSATDAAGRVDEFEYDGLDRMTAAALKNGTKLSFVYDDFGRCIRRVSPCTSP